MRVDCRWASETIDIVRVCPSGRCLQVLAVSLDRNLFTISAAGTRENHTE